MWICYLRLSKVSVDFGEEVNKIQLCLIGESFRVKLLKIFIVLFFFFEDYQRFFCGEQGGSVVEGRALQESYGVQEEGLERIYYGVLGVFWVMCGVRGGVVLFWSGCFSEAGWFYDGVLINFVIRKGIWSRYSCDWWLYNLVVFVVVIIRGFYFGFDDQIMLDMDVLCSCFSFIGDF